MKKLLFAAWRFLCAWTLFLFFAARLAQAWSLLHRFVWDRKFKTPVPAFRNLKEIGMRMRNYPYKYDGVRELWDAICTPEKVQTVLEAGDPEVVGKAHGNDCDEMGIWQLAAIKNSNLKEVLDAWLFTVVWINPNTFGPYGHNLTIMKMSDGKYQCLNYGSLSPKMDSPEDFVPWVVNQYDGDAVPLFWALHDLGLNPKMLRRG